MTTGRFARYVLRSSDPDAARTFYPEVLGEQFWSATVGLVQLPERAAARGAPPHWLGQVGQADVDAAVRDMVARGAEPLGPTYRTGNGARHAILRDPFGAVLGMSEDAVAPRAEPVAWHLLLVTDEVRAFEWYRAVFGWTAADRVDLGDQLGRHQRFRWREGGPIVGSVADAARWPHVHPQWLFCFEVAGLTAAVERVRQRGGHVIDPAVTPEGDQVAACDDPQGAAFALYQRKSG